MYDWTVINNMKLNEKKFELLRYGNDETFKLCTHYYSPTDTLISEKEIVKDLGVLMSNSTTFKEQISAVIEKGKDMSSWILRTFQSRNKMEMLTLWKTLVLPIIEYCSILRLPIHICDIQALEQCNGHSFPKYMVPPTYPTVNVLNVLVCTHFSEGVSDMKLFISGKCLKDLCQT